MAAVSFARRSVAPVLQLAEGTKSVSRGNYQLIKEFPAGDEINELTQSFNSMIKEVSETRHSLELQRKDAQLAQEFLERVLNNISSGVIVLDEWWTIVTTNPSARQILGEEWLLPGASLKEHFTDLVETLTEERKLSSSDDAFSFEYKFNGEQLVHLYLRVSPIS
ncbi:MAG: HAMP domain-containing protein, partial [Sutterella sp.]